MFPRMEVMTLKSGITCCQEDCMSAGLRPLGQPPSSTPAQLVLFVQQGPKWGARSELRLSCKD